MWDKELATAIKAVKLAGDLILDNFEKKVPIIRKSPKEFVTKLDVECQNIIVESLERDFPEYNYYLEETRKKQAINGLTWVIDPIDGTHNYISGLDNVGISLALISENNYHLGILFFPMKSMIFSAIEGQGAFCNGKQIHVGKNLDLSKSMVAYDNQFHLTKSTLTNFKTLLEASFTVRILGAASWDFALIAMGKLDARVWNSAKLVDIAAGYVIVKEAGGEVTDFNFSKPSLSTLKVVASNGLVHFDLVSLMQ